MIASSRENGNRWNKVTENVRDSGIYLAHGRVGKSHKRLRTLHSLGMGGGLGC